MCVLAPAAPAQRDTLPAGHAVEDFDALWTYVRDNYGYFHRKATDWDRVRVLYRPRAEAAATRRELLAVLEEVMEELYDPHAHLAVNSASSARLMPTGADLWAEWRGGRAILTDVRAGSAAEAARLRPGMQVHSVDGRPVRDALRDRLPAALRVPDPAADDWGLRAVLTGRRDAPVRVEVTADGGTRSIEFVPGVAATAAGPLSARVMDGDVGYVRIHNALGDLALVAAFDSALALLRDTRALVLDLRDTPSGGNTTVARGILGRLVSTTWPYQMHELPSEERQYGIKRVWVEHVSPRGPFTYERPVAVLVGRWTGSMGEGLAMALDGMERAERLSHLDGTPREDFVPAVQVPPAPPGEDATLAAALRLLRQ